MPDDMKLHCWRQHIDAGARRNVETAIYRVLIPDGKISHHPASRIPVMEADVRACGFFFDGISRL